MNRNDVAWRLSAGRVNSDVTERHDKKSIFASSVAASWLSAPRARAPRTRDFGASEREVGAHNASEREHRMCACARGGRRRMMYRVVELGSNCAGKWPRLEPGPHRR